MTRQLMGRAFVVLAATVAGVGCGGGIPFRPVATVTPCPRRIPLAVAVAAPIDARPEVERAGLQAPSTFAVVVGGFGWVRNVGSRLSSDDVLDLDPYNTAAAAPDLRHVVGAHVLAVTRATGVFAHADALPSLDDDDDDLDAEDALPEQVARARTAGAALLLTTEILHHYRGTWAETTHMEARTQTTQQVGATVYTATRIETEDTRVGTAPVESAVLRFTIYDVRGAAPRCVWQRTVTSTARPDEDTSGVALSGTLTSYGRALADMVVRSAPASAGG